MLIVSAIQTNTKGRLILGYVLSAAFLLVMVLVYGWDIREVIYFSFIQTIITWIYLEILYVFHSRTQSDKLGRSFPEALIGLIAILGIIATIINEFVRYYQPIVSRLDIILIAAISSIIFITIETYHNSSIDVFLKSRRDTLLRLALIAVFGLFLIDTYESNFADPESPLFILITFIGCRLVIDLLTLLPVGILKKLGIETY